MADTSTGGKGKKQEKKPAGARTSSSAHKAGIVRTHMGLPLKKLRRVFKANGFDVAKAYASAHGLMAEWRKIEASGLVERRQEAHKRRRLNRYEATVVRRATRRVAEAAAKAVAEKKALLSARAKKAAATKAANKAAKKAAYLQAVNSAPEILTPSH
ncbi:MAG: hypothetical protein A3C61_02520 [Candidatus Yanofskybacteria bacterium RIFCSPHIGHO2_02_FULL_39_10]|uniref:Uncharacterized protein n=1 Tax=Candidatus Yanofskybacteria bacterium RIFCSPHIGHO2_02_FULL_39_10 TaxID=1802674 RepID=A0A1F8F754_9BACT|nr:MAG: hypothetical protein A3C61_02520 [Candidatus Yanofskybacteria bacterium RIFCSPHIGHO2_02_FULL_39_10]